MRLPQRRRSSAAASVSHRPSRCRQSAWSSVPSTTRQKSRFQPFITECSVWGEQESIAVPGPPLQSSPNIAPLSQISRQESEGLSSGLWISDTGACGQYCCPCAVSRLCQAAAEAVEGVRMPGGRRDLHAGIWRARRCCAILPHGKPANDDVPCFTHSLLDYPLTGSATEADAVWCHVCA